jgi:predicted enzyme related to lactoylglutathione lyase
MMRAENCIDYVEIPVTDLEKAKAFFSALFGWSFEIWGDDYMSFNDGRFDGGFRRSAETAPSTGVLLIFFSTDLERDFDRVRELGATISEPIFPFPGGRRFHFVDPTGTEYAIWSAISNPSNGE